MTAKEILAKIKDVFNVPPAAPVVAAAPVAAPPVAPVVPTGTPYKLQDGSEISVVQAGEVPAVGDAVTVGGAPAADGELVLEDGSSLVVAGGVITEVKPAQPVTTDLNSGAQPSLLTAEAVQAMYAKFATGTPEERIANLEVMVKALMECNFGYEIRKGQDAVAIEAYKNSLATTQATVAEQASQLQAANQKIEKQDKVIEGLFELAEKLAETPTAEPKTLNGNKKEKFERANAAEKKLEGIAAAITQMKKQ